MRFRIRCLQEFAPAEPERLLAALPAGSRPVFLDSSDGGGGSLLAWSPDRALELRLEPGSRGRGSGPSGRWPLARRDPGAALESAVAGEEWERDLETHGPAGGWIGFLGFECGHAWEPFPWVPADPAGLPDLAFARYRRGLAQAPDGSWRLCWAEPLDAPPSAARHERQAVEEEARRLFSAPRPRHPAVRAAAMEPETPRALFQAGVENLREWIGAGELFQANLSHRLSGPLPEAPRVLYARLRQAQPTRMSSYWEDASGRALLSSSPERFLAVEAEELETRPIKGTARRGADPAADRRAAAALAASAKERAELTMIVDMARHDLGRLAVPGSVEVVSAGQVEAFPALWHRTATLRARWRPEQGLAALLAAMFPPASVTGAPKVRALQAIAELEGAARGPYCGALGWFEPGRPRGDFAVLIRTAVAAGGRLALRVGAGIVWDSDPGQEWEETLLKASYLRAALEAGGGRTAATLGAAS